MTINDIISVQRLMKHSETNKKYNIEQYEIRVIKKYIHEL